MLNESNDEDKTTETESTKAFWNDQTRRKNSLFCWMAQLMMSEFGIRPYDITFHVVVYRMEYISIIGENMTQMGVRR